MSKTPPRLATLLLDIFAPREGRDEILGDLNERFLDVVKNKGLSRARRWYWAQSLRSSAGFTRQLLRKAETQRHQTVGGSSGMGQRASLELIRSAIADMKYAFRSFRKQPGAILVAVLSLGVGIGANVTIFSVVDVYLFRSLPYPEPEQLVHVYSTMPERGWNYNNVSIPDFVDFREQSRTMDIAASYPGDVNLSGGDRPERIGSERTSWNYFDVFQISPIIGRTFMPEEERDGAHRVAIISNGLWQSHFGSDPSVLGQIIQLDAEPFTVIGVLPPDFRFGLTMTDIWTPLGVTGEEGNAHLLTAIGRLRAGSTVQVASADVATIADRVADRDPETRGGWSAGTRDLLRYTTPDESRVGMVILSVAAAFVLLIACTNVANVMLTRAAGRTREIAVMGALGAGRARIIRQLLTDSMVVALFGGVLGTLMSVAGIRWFMSLMPVWVPRAEEVGIDGRVLAFAVVVTALTGILFGIAPALRNSLPNFSQSLKDGGRGVAGTRGNRLRKVLVVSEVTLALTLLVGSTLLVRGFFSLQAMDTGWNAEDLLTLRISLPQSEYSDGESVSGFYRALIERMRTMPNVESASGVSALPLQDSWNTLYEIPGQEAPTPQQRPLAQYRYVLPGYFDTMEIAPVIGRNFDERDRPDTRPVIVVNEMLADLHWPDEDPIGKQIHLWGATREIVGVVENTMTLHDRTRPMVFTSALQSPQNSMSLVLRTTSEPASLVESIRTRVAALDPNLPLYRVRSMKEVVKEGRSMDTLMAKLMAAMAVVALVLSVAGVYGVISYS
ncbi:ADOP family duplicated permease, partial [Gemmatimonadota bacterium]